MHCCCRLRIADCTLHSQTSHSQTSARLATCGVSSLQVHYRACPTDQLMPWSTEAGQSTFINSLKVCCQTRSSANNSCSDIRGHQMHVGTIQPCSTFNGCTVAGGCRHLQWQCRQGHEHDLSSAVRHAPERCDRQPPSNGSDGQAARICGSQHPGACQNPAHNKWCAHCMGAWLKVFSYFHCPYLAL